MIKWFLKTGNYLTLFSIVYTNLDILLSKNYWKLHKIKFKHNTKELNISFFGGLSMFKEIYINQIYNEKINFEPSIIVDIGANVGFFSLWSSVEYPNSKIYSYEPVSKTFTILKNNIEQNKIQNVKIFNEAVSDKKGKSEIYLSYASGLSSLKGQNQNKEIINTITLKDIFEKNKINEIDILKMDTEGSEFEILSGSEDYISRIKLIMMEFHSEKDRIKIKSILEKHNFEIIKEQGQGVGILHAKRK